MPFIQLKLNLTIEEQEKVLKNTHSKKLNSFLNNQIYHLCSNHIHPHLKKYDKAQSRKMAKVFILQESIVKDSTNIELLKQFSKYHNISISKIIYLYILFFELEPEWVDIKMNQRTEKEKKYIRRSR
jgi:hypothetical protein